MSDEKLTGRDILDIVFSEKLPTLTEHRRRIIEKKKAEEDALKLQAEQDVARSIGLSLFKGSGPTLPDAALEDRRQRIRAACLSGKAKPHPFRCDHCGTRLYNSEPGVTYMSSPPKVRADCPGCGWLGYV